MSLEKALGYLEKAGYREHVIQLGESTATVAMAAEALGVEPGRIAKTMSFLQGDKAVLIITEGTAKIDNRKYKDTFHVKAKMIPFEEVENIIGHAPGGVCPFGINAGIDVYLDESLKQFDIVYPAAGNDHSDCNAGFYWYCRSSRRRYDHAGHGAGSHRHPRGLHWPDRGCGPSVRHGPYLPERHRRHCLFPVRHQVGEQEGRADCQVIFCSAIKMPPRFGAAFFVRIKRIGIAF